MLITYLNFYLVSIIITSLVLGLIVLKFKVPVVSIFIPLFLLFVILPGFLGYVYQIYFNPLPEIMVPDLRGIPLEIAEARAKALKLKVRTVGSISETEYPFDYVVSQQPEAGRKVKIGRTISLILSSKEEINMATEEGGSLP